MKNAEDQQPSPTPSVLSIEPGRTDLEFVGELLAKSRSAYESGITRKIEFRIEELKKLLLFMIAHEDTIISALRADFRKPVQETIVYEIEYVKNYIRNMLHHIRKWSKTRKATKPLYNAFDRIRIHKEPYGVILILGAWCYPIRSVLAPLAAGIASGNCVFLVPHNSVQRSFAFLTEELPKFLQPECYVVLDIKFNRVPHLLRYKFDYIYCTGLARNRTCFCEAALRNQTPFTMQLCGKCPCYIDDTANIAQATKRIWSAKLFNLGQTFTGPDYVVCSEGVEQRFLSETVRLMKSWLGENFRKDKHLYTSRIVNPRMFDHIVSLIEKCTHVYGGNYKKRRRFIEPTLCLDRDSSGSLLDEDYLGPILPIIYADSAEQAVDFINQREPALVIYVFTDLKETKSYFRMHTKSQVLSINDTFTYPNIDLYSGLGFGGNCIGRYRGRLDFDALTIRRAVTERSTNAISETYLEAHYPPFSGRKTTFLQRVMQKRRCYIVHVFAVVFAYISFKLRSRCGND